MGNRWYLAMFVVCGAIGLGTIYGAKSGLPWWALIVALIFGWMFVPVIGTLYATGESLPANFCFPSYSSPLEIALTLFCSWLRAKNRNHDSNVGWCPRSWQARCQHVWLFFDDMRNDC